jgi:hypothetical protein
VDAAGNGQLLKVPAFCPGRKYFGTWLPISSADRLANAVGIAGVPLAVMLAVEKAETSRDIPSRLFLVACHEMLPLLQFPVVLRDYTLVTLGP